MERGFSALQRSVAFKANTLQRHPKKFGSSFLAVSLRFPCPDAGPISYTYMGNPGAQCLDHRIWRTRLLKPRFLMSGIAAFLVGAPQHFIPFLPFSCMWSETYCATCQIGSCPHDGNTTLMDAVIGCACCRPSSYRPSATTQQGAQVGVSPPSATAFIIIASLR